MVISIQNQHNILFILQPDAKKGTLLLNQGSVQGEEQGMAFCFRSEYDFESSYGLNS